MRQDINKNDVVSSHDGVILFRSLLGIDNSTIFDWTFYDKEIEGPINIEPKGAYEAIKSGDVDDSAILPGDDAPTVVAKFAINDVLLNAGENYSIPIYVDKSYSTFGVEFRANIDVDMVEVKNITTDQDYILFEHHITEEGDLTVLMTNIGNNVDIGGNNSTAVFTIEFEAKENSLLSLAMDMESYHSYIATSDLELVVLGGEIGDMIGTGTNSEELSQLSVYPNPTSDYLNIDLKNVNVRGKIEFSVYGLNGQMLFSGIENTRIDVSGLNAGMYYYQVKIDNYSTTGKFIVVN